MAKLLNILLRKSDPVHPWGISMGSQPSTHQSIHITWVDEASLASQHLEPGDRVLEIEGIDASMLSAAEVDSILANPSRKLDLLIMKKPLTVKPVLSSNFVRNGESTKERFDRDQFWTSPPEDIRRFQEEVERRFFNRSPAYVTQSDIFRSLNEAIDERRLLDPREEKRRFWESCRNNASTSVRRFKWGDGFRPASGRGVVSPSSKSDEGSGSVFSNSDVSYRSKSCEPINPFKEEPRRIKPSNPFYMEYKSLLKEEKEEEKRFSQLSKKDFDSKCQFFEKASSPACVVSKKAKDIVEEHLKESKCQLKKSAFKTTESLRKPSEFNQKRAQSVEPLDITRNFDDSVYEKRVFTESYEKLSRGASPYDNVESIRREFTQEIQPSSPQLSRSVTPNQFYNNERISSPAPSDASDFQGIRTRVGSLLGATPLILSQCRCQKIVQETRQSKQVVAASSPGEEIRGCGPPPPPPPLQGSVPAVRIKSEIPQGKKSYEPPAAIQNAMMTKDKKPFTYTPGGLDLAEIKSPRMARRINRNAHMEDSCTPAHERVSQQVPQQPLPPSAMAAMQPQIAIPVFPPGGAPAPHGQHQMYTPPPPPPPGPSSAPAPPPLPSSSAPPPPPPPPPSSTNHQASHLTLLPQEPSTNSLQNGTIPGRSPPPFLQDIQNRPQLRPVGLPNSQPKASEPQPSPQLTAPLKPVAQPPKTVYEPPAPPPPVQLKCVSPPSPRDSFPPPPPPPQQVDTRPIQNVRPVQSASQVPFHKLDLQAAQAHAQSSAPTSKQTPSSSGNLNKSPAPWMTTRQVSKESPPPWAVRGSVDEGASPQSPQHPTRVVPIQIEGRDSPEPQFIPCQPHPQSTRPVQPQYTPPPQQQPPFIPVYQAPQYYTTVPTQPVQPRQQPDQQRTRIIPIQIEGAQSDPRTLQNQTSWTQGCAPIQSRSFRVLQKITGSDEDSASTPVGADASTMWWPHPMSSPSTPTPTPPPIGYPAVPFHPQYWAPSGPPQTPEEQRQFWEHYNAMCAYVMQMNAAAYCYSPYTVQGGYLCPPYPSDSEDCSGYSSSDEMTYYGKMFKQQAQARREQTQEANKLQSIKSVPDIRIFKEGDDPSSESDTDEGDANSDTESDIPHTLSVIFEDTEPSTSETESLKMSRTEGFDESDDDSSSTLNNEEETGDMEATVTVRLPLQLSFNRSKDNDEITMVVGAEEVQEEEKPDCLVITDIVREDSDPDVSATICIKRKAKKEETSGADSPIDFWKELSQGNDVRINETPNGSDDNEGHWEDDSSSTSVQTIKKGHSEGETCSESEVDGSVEKAEDEGSEEDESEESSEESESSNATSSSEEEEEEDKSKGNVVKEVDVQKQEESDEEDDSGVTSDLSRHISETDTDAECGGELGKMTKYQRTATHSRLFKLLQDECQLDDDSEDLTSRKERLSLPLNTHLSGEQESLSSSSGVNSPTSPTVTDRLVKELVQSLLSRKKGRHFRKLPLEKLHAAALRILQEDMDPYDTSSTDDSSLFMSPVDKSKDKPDANLPLSNPEDYGGNYQDYCQYYSTWGSTAIPLDYDILPSKAFKILQESSPLKIVPVRCPRVSDNPSPSSLNPEATKNPEET